jgi:ABC-2 type transport system ATP-binding protein
VLALLGPNGSGKTTTLKLVSTILFPDAGSVLVEGHDTVRQDQEVRQRVGFVLVHERSFFPRLTARENLEFFAALEEIPRVERARRVAAALELAGLDHAAAKLVMQFSSGMTQRLGLARALLKRPPILLLDEPTRSLDPGSAEQFWQVLRSLSREGTTILLATHSFTEAAAVADEVAILQRGRMIHHDDRPVRQDAAALRELYFCVCGRSPDDTLAEPEPLVITAGPEPHSLSGSAS